MNINLRSSNLGILEIPQDSNVADIQRLLNMMECYADTLAGSINMILLSITQELLKRQKRRDSPESRRTSYISVTNMVLEERKKINLQAASKYKTILN